MTNSSMQATNKNNGLQRSFDSLLNDFLRGSFPQARGMMSQDYRTVEHEDSYEIMFDVPGADKENATVNVTKENVLEVQISDKTSSDEEKVNSYSVMEKSWNLPLGKGVDTENIQASLERGVLTVNVPKRDTSGGDTTRIEIT